MRLESIGTDEATLVLPFRPELATIDDIVHGGAIASLIDTAGMAACWADDAEPESLAGLDRDPQRQLHRRGARKGPDGARGRRPPRAQPRSSARSRSPSRTGGSSPPARSSSGLGRPADDPGRGRGARAQPPRDRGAVVAPARDRRRPRRDRRPRVRRARPVRGAGPLRPRHDLARRLRERPRWTVARRTSRRHGRTPPRRRRAAVRDAARRDGDRRAQRPATATGWRPRAARSRSR